MSSLQPPKSAQHTCQKHGQYTAYQLAGGDWSGCAECALAKHKQKEQEKFAAKKKEENQKRARREALRNGTVTIPKDFKQQQAECSAHGTYTSYSLSAWNTWTPCPQCADAEAAREEALAVAEQRNVLFTHANVPARFSEVSLDSWRAQTDVQKEVKRKMVHYIAQFDDGTPQSIVMLGGVGTGKTHLAIAAGKAIIHHYQLPIIYTTASRFFDEIKATWHGEAEYTKAQVLARYTHPDLLIMDEVGVQHGSEFEMNSLFELFNARYEKRRANVFISNLGVPEFRDLIGERVADRLREDGVLQLVFDWDSWRKK